MQSRRLEDSAHLVAGQSYFVIVDGFVGSGKSTLAGRLAAPLRAVHLELDSFLNKNDEGGYIISTTYGIQTCGTGYSMVRKQLGELSWREYA